MLNNENIVQVQSLDGLAKFGFKEVVAAIGVFDGIHLGHRKLIDELILMSEECSSKPVIITFHPHPRIVLMHDTKLRFLRDPASKTKIMFDLGIKAIVTIPFTKQFASLPPNKFIKSFMMPDNIKLKGICVGSKWRFGRKAEGNQDILHQYADKYSFKFSAVDEVKVNSQLISSTAIRKAIKKADFATANFMLACNYKIIGEVKKVEKTEYGLTKAILFIKYGILPPPGKYFVKTDTCGETQAEVITEDSLIIFHKHILKNTKTIEFEFVKWI